MINIEEFRSDLKDNTLEYTLDKHQVSLKDAFNQIHHVGVYRKNGESIDDRYVYDKVDSKERKYKIQKNHEYYGSYKTVDDCILVKKELDKVDWDKTQLKTIREKLGV